MFLDGETDPYPPFLSKLPQSRSEKVMENLKQPAGVVIFDLDNALLQNKFLDACAKEFNFSQALAILRHIDLDQLTLARRTASFLLGKTRDQLLSVASTIPVVDGIKEVIHKLKERGYVVGVVSEAYLSVTEFLSKRINADFCFANELKMHGDFMTGELAINNCFLHTDQSICQHRYCRSNVLLNAARKYNLAVEKSIFVGDLELDSCILKQVGRYIDIRSSNELFTLDARKRLVKESFDKLLTYTHTGF